jgi:hypothetical protein
MKLLAGSAMIIALFCSAFGRAESAEPLPSEFLVGAGVLNVRQGRQRDQSMGVIEYRFPELKWNVRPWAGFARAERGTNFVSAGVLYTLEMSSGLKLSAGWAPTFYDMSHGWDLGAKLNFYSFIEAGYGFKNGHVMSLRFGHLSNAGLGYRNPGTETVQLSFAVPFLRKK